jgi:hypothetical protein
MFPLISLDRHSPKSMLAGSWWYLFLTVELEEYDKLVHNFLKINFDLILWNCSKQIVKKT